MGPIGNDIDRVSAAARHKLRLSVQKSTRPPWLRLNATVKEWGTWVRLAYGQDSARRGRLLAARLALPVAIVCGAAATVAEGATGGWSLLALVPAGLRLGAGGQVRTALGVVITIAGALVVGFFDVIVGGLLVAVGIGLLYPMSRDGEGPISLPPTTGAGHGDGGGGVG